MKYGPRLWGEAAKIVQNLYLDCEFAEARNQKLLTHDLGIARETLSRHGAITLDTNLVNWAAINQVSREKQSIQLPRFFVGGQWLGQNTSPDSPSLIVDEVRHLTQAHCTIFQRINEAGDMLRVDTSVLATNGNRAVGTFIPSHNADGSPNPVIDTVLKGETFRGRAFVVSEYHAAAYEPVWNGDKSRIIGMLYVGVSMTDINKDFHDSMVKIVVGKMGYACVLGGKGDNRGRYIISAKGLRDGESVWETRDNDGRMIIQSMVNAALGAAPGTISTEHYFWKNPGDAAARKKYAAFTYFPAWDWVVIATGYEEDFYAAIQSEKESITALIRWVAIVTAFIGLLGFAASILFANKTVKSISGVIKQVSVGANQVSVAAGASGAIQPGIGRWRRTPGSFH